MSTIAYDHQIFALQRYGGISRYFCEIAQRIPHLSQLATKVVAPIHLNEYLASSEVSKIGLFRPASFRGAGRLYRLPNRIAAPFAMRGVNPDLVHWTYFAPFKPPHGSKTVVTIYDMIHELFPDDFAKDSTSRDKQHCVENADHVICISDSTKEDLMRLFEVPSDKISVTHLGFSSAFRQAVRGEANGASTARPYLLYVGHRRGYKGFSYALRAYASSNALRSEFDLVTFGGYPFDATEHALMRSLKLREGSVRRESGTDESLAAAYRGARAFVYPSRYEGFGIPPLEAMASGCPVACSNTSSLPEVVGSAAELFAPDDVNALREALERVCFDEARRLDLIERGLQRSHLFSWDRCAQETASIYARLMAA